VSSKLIEVQAMFVNGFLNSVFPVLSYTAPKSWVEGQLAHEP
jgi:hypothetical protein